MAERTVYRNLWYGLRLEHPAGWQVRQVRQVPGCVLVSPDASVMPTLRGDQIMINPVDGRRYEVPLSYGTYWSDAAQRVYRTSSPDVPPDVGANRLEPI